MSAALQAMQRVSITETQISTDPGDVHEEGAKDEYTLIGKVPSSPAGKYGLLGRYFVIVPPALALLIRRMRMRGENIDSSVRNIFSNALG